MDVRVSVLANDTVGTLVTQAYSDADCYVGVILGTGSNAAYVERTSAIPKWHHADVTGEMIINMEWGGFDSADRKILPLTAYDRQLDRESVHPTEQIYEKLISGMYLGEITRIVLTRLVRPRMCVTWEGGLLGLTRAPLHGRSRVGRRRRHLLGHDLAAAGDAVRL